MKNFKYKTLFKAILEQVDLPDNAVIADLGCKDATFLLAFQEAFPNKIKSAIGVDITDKWFEDVKYDSPIELKVMNCSKNLILTITLLILSSQKICLNVYPIRIL